MQTLPSLPDLPALPAASLPNLPEHLGNGARADEVLLSVDALKEACKDHMARVLDWIVAVGEQPEPPRMTCVEASLFEQLRTLGLLLLTLFLAVVERRIEQTFPTRLVLDGRTYKRRPPQRRNLMTRFGVVRYSRRYYRCLEFDGTRGLYPTDILLGFNKRRTTLTVSSMIARLATEMSYERACEGFKQAHGFTTSTELAQRTALWLGGYADAYFEQAPAPEDDGEHLIVQIDAKGVPMVTDEEMKKRCGKREPNPHPGSARHRGRARRKGHNRKSRHPEPGTAHKKNARMATMIVLYTLRRNGDALEGPINKIVWTTFGCKREAFELARREAVKRGFDPDKSQRIQLLTDGDNDYQRLAAELFPSATHTVDLMHVLEYTWSAAKQLFVHQNAHKVRERWAEKQRKRILGGHLDLVLADLKRGANKLARKGGAQARARELRRIYNYLDRRAHLLDYKALREHDLEIATGAVEGAVRHVIGMRFDQSPMRWRPEGVEVMMPLRCININGAWDGFIKYVQARIDAENHRDVIATLLRQCERGPVLRVVR